MIRSNAKASNGPAKGHHLTNIDLWIRVRGQERQYGRSLNNHEIVIKQRSLQMPMYWIMQPFYTTGWNTIIKKEKRGEGISVIVVTVIEITLRWGLVIFISSWINLHFRNNFPCIIKTLNLYIILLCTHLYIPSSIL